MASVLSGCGVEDLCSLKVASAIASPSGETKAIIVQHDCGATTSMAYYVHVLSANEEPSEENSVFKSDRTEGISIFWWDDMTLVVYCDRARFFNFKNFWQSKNNKFRKEIKILEIQRDNI